MKEKLMDTQCKHHRIVIDCDGDTTRVSVVIDGRETKETIARQTPEGKPGREVKRYANPGEYIRIVNAEDESEENYCNGDILLVTEYYEDIRDGWVMAKGANVVIGPEEYVVLEGYPSHEPSVEDSGKAYRRAMPPKDEMETRIRNTICPERGVRA